MSQRQSHGRFALPQPVDVNIEVVLYITVQCFPAALNAGNCCSVSFGISVYQLFSFHIEAFGAIG